MTSALLPLADKTRRGQISERLKAAIMDGVLAPGQRLTEVELARRLGVSRAPLREAIRELVERGLLVSEPYKGLYVRSASRKDLRELYALRTVLEQMAFRECWDRRSAESLVDIRRRHARLDEAIVAGDADLAIERELQLHSWCYEMSGNALLHTSWERIRPNLQFYFLLHQRAHGRKGPLREAHDVYVRLATGDDLEAMLAHCEEHMRQGLAKTLLFLSE